MRYYDWLRRAWAAWRGIAEPTRIEALRQLGIE